MGDEALIVVEGELTNAAEAINAIIEGLGGGASGMAGRGFNDVSMGFLSAGDESVQRTIEEFADRWSWGVRHLVRGAGDVARTLQLTNTRFVEQDDRLNGAAKVLTNSVAGNPYLTEQEVMDMSWSELGTSVVESAISIEDPAEGAALVDEAKQRFSTTWQVAGPQAASNALFLAGGPSSAAMLTTDGPLPSPAFNSDVAEQVQAAVAADASPDTDAHDAA